MSVRRLTTLVVVATGFAPAGWAYRSTSSLESMVRSATWIAVVEVTRVPAYQGQYCACAVRRHVVGRGPQQISLPTARIGTLAGFGHRSPPLERVGAEYIYWLRQRADGTYRALGRRALTAQTVRLYPPADRADFLAALPVLRRVLTAPVGKVATLWTGALRGKSNSVRLMLLEQLASRRWRGAHPIPCLQRATAAELAQIAQQCVALVKSQPAGRVHTSALSAASVMHKRLVPESGAALRACAVAALHGRDEKLRQAARNALARMGASSDSLRRADANR